MFYIKMRARYLSHGIKLKAALFSALFSAAALCCGVCFLLAALCFAYGSPAVFGDTPLLRNAWLHAVLPWALLLLGSVLAVFCFSLRFACRALYFYRTDETQRRPESFIGVKSGLRALGCAVYALPRRLGWAALTLSPGCVTLYALPAFLKTTGLPRGLFVSGLALAAVQLTAGALAAFVLWQRYLTAAYLLYLNPLLPAREAVRSAALLSRGRLLYAAVSRVKMLPWRVLTVFGAARPFARAYVGLQEALLCRQLYSQTKKI